MTTSGPGALSDQSIGDFLEQLAARVPAPGGGATAALHAAQAAALLAMVGRYSTGERHLRHRDVIDEVIAESDAQREACLALAAADAAAFEAVAAAYRLPRGSAGERAERRRAIAAATAEAAGPPADVLRSALLLVGLAQRLLPVANHSVVTDIAAATEAARAAATTARLNIEVNLAAIDDRQRRRDLVARLDLVEDVIRRAAAVERTVRGIVRR